MECIPCVRDFKHYVLIGLFVARECFHVLASSPRQGSTRPARSFLG